MCDYILSKIHPDDRRMNEQINQLLLREQIQKDKHIDVTYALLDDCLNPVATASRFGNTLRSIAVDRRVQGQGLLNTLLTALIEDAFLAGFQHLFLYTKPEAAHFFADLGFYALAEVPGTLVFMENQKHGFSDYLKALQKETDEARSQLGEKRFADQGKPTKFKGTAPNAVGSALPAAGHDGDSAIVMNANPFTLGHRFLVETAASSAPLLHLFVLSEDKSLFPFQLRMQFVRACCADIPNLCIHASGPYIISGATFPSYFLRDEETAITSHAKLDLAIFQKIAVALSIQTRFAGEEPTSFVTGLYNQMMRQQLPKAGIRFVELPRRKTKEGAVISASFVRAYLQKNDFSVSSDCSALAEQLPAEVLSYLQSPDAASVLAAIRASSEVVHY